MTWPCSLCTFSNCEELNECEICSNPKSKRQKKEVVVLKTVPITLSLATKPPECKLEKSAALHFKGRISMTNVVNSRNGLKMEDLIQKQGMRRGIFAAFCLDDDWLLNHLPSQVPFVFATAKPKRLNLPDDILRVNETLSFVFPPLSSSWGCMHIKLMIMFYEAHVRVVVPSANLVDYDWTSIENIVFYQDFPLLQKGKAQNHSAFLDDLLYLARDMGIPLLYYQDLSNYDFSAALGSLIISKPTQSMMSDVRVFGQTSLCLAVRNLQNEPIDPAYVSHIYCQVSCFFDPRALL